MPLIIHIIINHLKLLSWLQQKKSSVIVELQDLVLTERKDDRFGRVVTTRSLNEDDLVKIAVSRRTDLSATILKASLEILKQLAIEQIANGASVRYEVNCNYKIYMIPDFCIGISGAFRKISFHFEAPSSCWGVVQYSY